jgi:4-oxalomesaconate tautomerase
MSHSAIWIEPMLRAISCTVIRGGTSKGLYFDARDLPADTSRRDAVLLAAMGSPHARQIDGMGGAHPLTSKIALISPSEHERADVDYLFLQAAVDKAELSDSQTCGNILAGVGPWAIEHGLVAPHDAVTPVCIRMLNTGAFAVAHVPTPDREVEYEGEARIDGVPGTAAAIAIDFEDIAGSSCGALLPTGAVRDNIEGTLVTCIDNGMPVVILDAACFSRTGAETPEALEADGDLKARIEAIRLVAGERMRLGDVTKKTVPKMCLVSPPRAGGAVATRTFIPHRVHEAIGVLGAVSVATACMLKGSVAAGVARPDRGGDKGIRRLDVEHPTGFFTVEMDVVQGPSGVEVKRAALLRTARKLMVGQVFIPSSAWGGA